MTSLCRQVVTLAAVAPLFVGLPAWSQSDEDPLPRRGYFGVSLGESVDAGVPITAVSQNTTASDMGIAPGDVIVSVDDNRTSAASEVQALISRHRGGDRISLQILRNGESVDLQATLRSMPTETMANATLEYGSVVTGQGVRLRTITSVPEGLGEPAPAVFLIQGGSCGSIDDPWTPSPGGQVGLMHSIGSRGFVTMRVEKSGVGDSGGEPCSAIGYDDELAGYLAGLRALKTHSVADPDRVFLVGISLGGVFAPVLANETDVAGISVYGTLPGPPDPYPGRSDRFFREFKSVDIASAWSTVDVPVQLIRGQYEDRATRIGYDYMMSVINAADPGRAEYVELEKLDHCWTRHETFEDSIDNCGGGAATSDLSDTILEFLDTHS